MLGALAIEGWIMTRDEVKFDALSRCCLGQTRQNRSVQPDAAVPGMFVVTLPAPPPWCCPHEVYLPCVCPAPWTEHICPLVKLF